MGNYTKLHGKIYIKDEKSLETFKKRWNESLEDWLKFDKLFIEDIYQDKERNYYFAKIHFNPKSNAFKLVGYPSNFEEFFSFFRNNTDLIEAFSIFGDIEDDLFMFWDYDEYYKDEECSMQHDLKIIEKSTLKESERAKKWHEYSFNEISKANKGDVVEDEDGN